MTDLPCGCKHCGCLCDEHYRDGAQECRKHRTASTALCAVAMGLWLVVLGVMLAIVEPTDAPDNWPPRAGFARDARGELPHGR